MLRPFHFSSELEQYLRVQGMSRWPVGAIIHFSISRLIFTFPLSNFYFHFLFLLCISRFVLYTILLYFPVFVVANSHGPMIGQGRQNAAVSAQT